MIHQKRGASTLTICIDGSNPRAGFDLKLEHGPDLGVPQPVRRRRTGRQRGGSIDPFIQIKTKLVWTSVRTCLREKRRGSRCVRSNPAGPALEHLYSGRGKFDQSPQDVCNDTLPAMHVPERLPCLVSFPVVSSVEELDAPPVESGRLPAAVVNRFGWRMHNAKQVPCRRARWVRPLAPGNVSVGRKNNDS
jgi:hypothetical protein